jgi:hypothetical protein
MTTILRLLLSVFFLAPVEKPLGLACLERYYGARAQYESGTWWLLFDRTRVAFADGKAKSAEERLEHPDVQDVFYPRYRTGAIRVVADENEDPGRARIDALFAFAYPRRDRVQIDFMGHKVTVHKKAAPAFSRVVARLEAATAHDRALLPLVTHLGGTLAERNIAGTDRRSAHAYGIAVDLDPERSDYWRWGPRKHETPQAIVDAFEAEGFIWGGRWFHYDTMHFEYRPELLDARCYPPAK